MRQKEIRGKEARGRKETHCQAAKTKRTQPRDDCIEERKKACLHQQAKSFRSHVWLLCMQNLYSSIKFWRATLMQNSAFECCIRFELDQLQHSSLHRSELVFSSSRLDKSREDNLPQPQRGPRLRSDWWALMDWRQHAQELAPCTRPHSVVLLHLGMCGGSVSLKLPSEVACTTFRISLNVVHIIHIWSEVYFYYCVGERLCNGWRVYQDDNNMVQILLSGTAWMWRWMQGETLTGEPSPTSHQLHMLRYPDPRLQNFGKRGCPKTEVSSLRSYNIHLSRSEDRGWR